jgi:hypothetical protein
VVQLLNFSKKGLRFLKYQILKISFKNKSKTQKAHIFDPQIGVKNGREGLSLLLFTV